MRILRAAGALALCASLAAGCGKAHRNTLVLKVIGKPNAHQLDETATVLRRRLDLLGLRHASVRAGPRSLITITARHRLSHRQQQVLTRRGSFAIYDLEADLAPESMNGYAVRASTDRLRARPQTAVARCDLGRNCPGVASEQRARTYWYLFQYYPRRVSDPIPEVTERDLDRAKIRVTGRSLALTLTAAGSRRFRQITQTEAARGQALATAAGRGRTTNLDVVTRFAQHFAIVLDGELLSTPYIDYKQSPDGIDPSGGIELSGAGQDLAIVLRSGPLPLRVAVAR